MPLSSPFQALMPDPGHSGGPQQGAFKARITEVQKDKTGSNYSFLFTVKPLRITLDTGYSGGVIKNVTLCVPGMGSLEDPAHPPTGMYYFPEVGSIVRIERDADNFSITGFYTGPCRTSLETGSDPEGRTASYNPGLEIDHHRNTGFPGFDLPHWSFGLEPGDVVLGKGQSRVKITSQGVVVGADLFCARIYKTDGGLLERWAERETKGIGYWEHIRHGRGTTELATAATVMNDPVNFPPPRDAWVAHTTIYECAPELGALRPYIMEQRGYLSRLNVDDGRSQIYTGAPNGRVAAEMDAQDFVVSRQVVAHPVADMSGNPFSTEELKSVDYTTSDHQLDADGSFRERHGNLAKRPGAQTNDSETAELDLSVEYDNARNVYHIRIGRGGCNAARITVRGALETDSAIEVEAYDVKATVRNKLVATAKNAEITVQEATKLTTRTAEVIARDEVKVTATNKVTIKAPQIILDGEVLVSGNISAQKSVAVAADTTINGKVAVVGNVAIAGQTVVQGEISSPVDVKAGTVSLRYHVHNYTWTDPGGSAATMPPL